MTLAPYENRHRLTKLVGVLSYNLYQARKEPDGLQINVGPNGLKMQSK